jgi:streptogramin lyase
MSDRQSGLTQKGRFFMFGIQFALDLLRHKSGRRRKPIRYRAAVQALEDRYLLSTFQEFPLPPLPRDPTDDFHRERITTGPDGNLWFIDGVYGFSNSNERVGRITPDGNVTEFSIDNNTATQLYNITTGPDGNLWMLAIRTPNRTNEDQLVVIRMTPNGDYTVFGAFLGHDFEDFVSNVSPVVAGPDGNLWYTASFYSGPLTGSIVGRITPTGDVTNFNFPILISQFRVGGGITAGPDGTLWVSIDDGLHGGTPGVQRISPDGQLSDVIPGSHPLSEMVTDANGNVWGLMRPGSSGTVIERITPDGTISDFQLPVRDPVPSPEPELDPCHTTITAGPDGNIWFSDPYANQIGNIAPDGTVTEYAVPTPNSFPAGITTGPDGNIWFTELGSGQIGEFILNGGGGAGGAARSAPPAQGLRPVNVAAVEALFAGTGRPVVDGVINSQPSTVARVDDAFSARPLKAVIVPTGPQVRAAAGSLPHSQHEDRAVNLDITGLTDPLTNAL